VTRVTGVELVGTDHAAQHVAALGRVVGGQRGEEQRDVEDQLGHPVDQELVVAGGVWARAEQRPSAANKTRQVIQRGK